MQTGINNNNLEAALIICALVSDDMKAGLLGSAEKVISAIENYAGGDSEWSNLAMLLMAEIV